MAINTYEILAVIATLLIGLTAYLKWKLTYWERSGVPTLNPTIPFGDMKKLLFGKSSFGLQFRELYHALKNRGLKYGGVYLGPVPLFIPVDPELIKHILQIDFQHFVNHGGFINEVNDPLSGHLFNLENEKWRNMRIKLTPTFTSGKMKMMFQTLADCAVGLKDIMEEAAIARESVDIKEILARFTTDTIGSVAFGLECNSLKDPDAPFRKYGKKSVEIEGWDRIKLIIQGAMPRKFLDVIKFKLTKVEVEEFFMKAIKDTVEYREKNNIYRKDFLHLLLQLKNRGTVADDEKITEDGRSAEIALTINELAAQAFVFFMGGFETSSTTMTFALYELAINPQVQEKLRDEVKRVLEKHGGQMTYDAMMEMGYMDKVLNETLRKYPPIPVLPRQCNKDYIIPNTSICLKKGVAVAIPTMGIHTDPEYYPDPEVFDPERFSEQNKKDRSPLAWLPFGEGPRMCIGLRFGIMQSKVGLTTLLRNYRIKLSNKTKFPMELDMSTFITTAAGGIWLDVEKLN